MPGPSTSRSTLAIQAAGRADIGRRREQNEDAVLVRSDLRLYLVADGAGGQGAGNVASARALQAITAHFEATERVYREQPDVDRFGIAAGARRLAHAIRKANREIIQLSKSSQTYGGIGSTIVGATPAAHAPVLHVAHVGDSRCYRLRGAYLEPLTQDHSLVNDVVELHPDINDEALERMPRKVVTRALGLEENVRISVRSYEIAPGDVYLLCSDGLTGELADESIRRVLALPLDPDERVERLIRMANDAGGSDNIAAVVFSCDFEPAPVVAPEPYRDPAMTSAPEIMVLGIESEADLDDTSRIRVVPSESVSSGLIDSLGGFLRARRGGPGRCAGCGEVLVAEAVFCPHCGSRRS